MLKGVNKQVIEVVETGSDYFERALLVVNPKMSSDPEQIYVEAAKLFNGSEKASGRHVFKGIFQMAGAAAVGAAVSGALVKLLG